ncbi:MAG: DUF1211 domain-containing protein [Alphaproteobacteria bacterium]|nr:MAG: DUF1211 domain-containing protein [Alphaproteobacteria bacterium]
MANTEKITSTRLEAFSDGVIAIIITIMVLELKIPRQDTLEGLLAQWPIFVSYFLSFILVAEYWMNHHLLFHLIRHVDNRLLWSNLLVLFCISLIPFFTGFMGENHISAFSVAAYSAWSMVCAISFMVLLTAVFRHVDMQEEDKRCLRQAAILKCIIAIALYGLAVAAAPYSPMAALALNFIVAVLYFLPTTWLEKKERS